MRLTAVLAFAVLLSGCLATEETEIRVLREQGEPAIVIWELRNIHSDERNDAKIREDFNTLIEDWRGDKTLAEQARNDGILVKDRELFIRDGKIFGREIGIVENLRNLDIEQSPDRTVIQMKWNDSEGRIIETNGHIVRRGGAS